MIYLAYYLISRKKKSNQANDDKTDNPKKSPFAVRKGLKVVAAVVFSFTLFIYIIAFIFIANKPETKEISSTSAQTAAVTVESTTKEKEISSTSALTTAVTSESAVSTEEAAEKNSADNTSDTTESAVKPETTTAPHRTGDEIVGISDKDIDELSPVFYSKVPNDKTNSWKCLVVNSTMNITEYALSAYKKYYNGAKLLVIENPYTKESAAITGYSSSFIDVTVYKYVDKEENDAVKMLTGGAKANYWVYTDNGDIEKIY